MVCLTDERRSALFPAGTIVRDPHHREQGCRTKLKIKIVFYRMSLFYRINFFSEWIFLTEFNFLKGDTNINFNKYFIWKIKRFLLWKKSFCKNRTYFFLGIVLVHLNNHTKAVLKINDLTLIILVSVYQTMTAFKSTLYWSFISNKKFPYSGFKFAKKLTQMMPCWQN